MARARTDEAKDERRQALLAAALDEFFEKGFAAHVSSSSEPSDASRPDLPHQH